MGRGHRPWLRRGGKQRGLSLQLAAFPACGAAQRLSACCREPCRRSPAASTAWCSCMQNRCVPALCTVQGLLKASQQHVWWFPVCIFALATELGSPVARHPLPPAHGGGWQWHKPSLPVPRGPGAPPALLHIRAPLPNAAGSEAARAPSPRTAPCPHCPVAVPAGLAVLWLCRGVGWAALLAAVPAEAAPLAQPGCSQRQRRSQQWCLQSLITALHLGAPKHSVTLICITAFSFPSATSYLNASLGWYGFM